MHLQLYRDSQDQFSIKRIPNNFQKTAKFLLITQELKENKALGQTSFLMHVSYSSETVFLPALLSASIISALSFCQHYLAHHEHSGPCIYMAGAENLPHP